MSLKQEIETWVEAMDSYDKQSYSESLQTFSNIADTSKILFNCGVIHATLGEHDRAVDCYQRAIGLDQYLAVAYFQQGVSNFLVGDFDEALANFNDTLLYLRGNTFIDYEQLGLKFKLYSCEVLFNRGLCYMYLQQEEPGMQDFTYARKEKMTADHDVIEEAIKENAEGYTVFSIPVGIIYRPNEAKVKNLKQKDYLGRARLVATANANNVSTGFQGADRRAEAQKSNLAKDDRPAENISFAATNLVNKDIRSRVGRDQSAPPAIGRPQFPPTPPPEAESKTPQLTARSMTMRNGPPRNLQLNGLSNGRTSMDRANSFASSVTAGPQRTDTLSSDPGLRRADTANMHNFGRQETASLGGFSRQDTGTLSAFSRQDTFDQFTMVNPTPRVGGATPSTASVNSTPRLNTNLGPSPRGPQGSWSAVEERTSRTGTMRSVSETRAPPTASRRQFERSPAASTMTTPKPLFAEQARPSRPESEEGGSYDEVYSMYTGAQQTPALKRTSTNRQTPKEAYIEEEEEHDEEDVIIESDSADDTEQVASPPPAPRPVHSRTSSSRHEPKVAMKKIRVKVHANDDIRYIMINGSTIDYDDFESKVRAKFGLRGQLKMKSKDEDCGDMITMGDQDDLDTLVEGAVDLAKRERSEMGKMEVSVEEAEVPIPKTPASAISFAPATPATLAAHTPPTTP